MEPLTDVEKNLVKMLLERISDILPEMTDFQKHERSLVRFVRARDQNLDKAEQMIRGHIEWRKNNKVDDILKMKFPDFERDFPIWITGLDNHGLPGRGKELTLYLIQILEQILKGCEHLSKDGEFVTQILNISDFEKFSFRQFTSKDTIKFVLELITMIENQYPELLRASYIINAPKVFEVLWTLVKPILTKRLETLENFRKKINYCVCITRNLYLEDILLIPRIFNFLCMNKQRTLSKVHIFGCNKDAWKTDLKKYIDFETNFPSTYGGGVTSCQEYKCEYGMAAFSSQKFELFEESAMTSVKIDAGMTHAISFNVSAGSKLSWNFKTEGWDIGFRLCLENRDDVIKYSRVDSHLVLQRGEIICEEKGQYTFKFDNTHSTFRDKTLKYCIRASDQEKTENIQRIL